PAFMLLFKKIHKHYDEACLLTRLPPAPPSELSLNHAVVVPIARVDRPAVKALEYARTLSPQVTAVHVAVDDAGAQAVERAWAVWGHGVPLVVIDSPYRSLTRPLL